MLRSCYASSWRQTTVAALSKVRLRASVSCDPALAQAELRELHSSRRPSHGRRISGTRLVVESRACLRLEKKAASRLVKRGVGETILSIGAAEPELRSSGDSRSMIRSQKAPLSKLPRASPCSLMLRKLHFQSRDHTPTTTSLRVRIGRLCRGFFIQLRRPLAVQHRERTSPHRAGREAAGRGFECAQEGVASIFQSCCPSRLTVAVRIY